MAIGVSAAILVLVLAGVVYISLFVGWGPGRAEPGDVVGTWNGPRGAQVTLREDGSATATKVPGDYSGYNPVHAFSGKGTWTLRKPKHSLAEQAIELEIGTGTERRATIELVVDGRGARDGIHVPVDADSALGIDFHKGS
ncbi:hypothetical protein [Streptomyces sp. NPDC007100]|uniref:hypothetical protein n=1 Tax=Streptomyces sp. NPDC007100 TaxID=3155602 RepID=UPI0033F57863